MVIYGVLANGWWRVVELLRNKNYISFLSDSSQFEYRNPKQFSEVQVTNNIKIQNNF